MKACLVDTDVLIEVLRQRDSGILGQWSELGAADTLVAYSPVTAAEVWQGAREPETRTIEALFESLTCIPVDTAIGRKAGEYLRRFRSSHGIELGDALIAATATVQKVPLWTRNRKHYPMPEIRLL